MKRATRVLHTAIWAPFMLASAHARAEDSPTQKVQAAPGNSTSSEPSHAAPNTGPTAPTPEQLAAIAYQKAVASYANGDVAAALDNMRESYRLSKRAELLYNLAQLEEELKNCSEALTNYRQYLELVPNGRYRESAEQARVRLEQQCPPLPAAPVAPAPTAPPSSQRAAKDSDAKQPDAASTQPSYWTTRRAVGWTAIATGTLAGVGAVYFQLEALHARDQFQQSVDNAYAGGPPVDMSLQDRQHRYNHVAIGLGIASGAMIASGALVLLLDPVKHEQRSRSASLYALPGFVGASYAQRF